MNKNQLKPILDAIARVRPELVRLSFENNNLTATATNGVISFSVSVPYNGGYLETFVVNATLFASIVSKLPEGDFDIALQGNACIVKSPTCTFKLTLASNESIPNITFVEKMDRVIVASSTLVELVTKTSFSCANKQTRPMLTGINLCANNGVLVAVGLDGMRMSRFLNAIDSKYNFNITVPSNEIKTVVGLLDISQDVSFCVENNQLHLRQNDLQIVLSLINGEYPAVDRLVPSQSEYQLTFTKLDLINALEMVTLLSSDKKVAHLLYANDKCEIECDNNQVGNAKTVVKCESKGDTYLDIYFNASFVLEALNSIDDASITIEFNGSLKPFFIRSSGGKQLSLFTPIRA